MQRPTLICVGCGDEVTSWPCVRCGHKYVRIVRVDVQLRLFYDLLRGR
jgi:rRNA maturation endonuclease Nob1